MDFLTDLKTYQRATEKRLVAFIEEKRARYTDREVERWVYDVLGDFVLRGGKRIRAIMAITAYEGASGDFDSEEIYLPACAMEFLDAYFLVQDDVIDSSDLRRGKASAHVMLSKYAQNVAGVPAHEADAFGLNVAIGVGDIFNAWGIECILRSDFPDDRKLAALDTYNAACETICVGEIKDIYLGLTTVTATEEEYIDMIREKTVYYVTRNQALVGLDLADAPQEMREAMIRVTEPLGLAFQIRDDILDLFSTEEELGKPIGTDIKEGKDTIMIIHARNTASGGQWAAIQEVLGDAEASDDDIRKVRELMQETDSIAYAERLMDRYLDETREAIDILDATGFADEIIDFYNGMVDFIGTRRH